MKSVKRAYSAPDLHSVKKAKKTSTRSISHDNNSNTLLNYFQSNRKIQENIEKKPSVSDNLVKTKDLSIIVDDEDESEIDSLLVKAEITTAQNGTKNAFDILLGKNQQTVSNNKKEEDWGVEDESSYPEIGKPFRKCPFYKRIEGTQITVDAFNYGDIENCNAYFLSHFHYDHYVGLTNKFSHRLICSKVTANLVVKKIRVDPKYIVGVEMNKFVNVYDNNDSIQVALIDANHCPGSVMFLFRVKKNGKYILHTGDFRASDDLIKSRFFQDIHIDTIHLDTTYLDSFYTFQPQSKIIASGVDLALNEMSNNPNTLILCGSYTIGKERIFIAIAEALDVKVCVSREKLNILSCLEDKKLDKMITLNPNETNLHVISMGMLNIKDLKEYMEKYPKYENLIAIKPTGWSHKDNNGKAEKSQNGVSIEKQWKNITIYGIEYSEHSSFDELKSCITTLRPRRIIPTVNVGRKDQRDKMQTYFNEWLNSNKQTKLFY